MKLCKDCKHYVAPKRGWFSSIDRHGCANPSLVDPVTGDSVDPGFMRIEFHPCGPKARYFEPIEGN